MKVELNSEKLAYWYLRLNGFLTIENFILHRDNGGGQRTDADILGVRFPFRREMPTNPMIDEPHFSKINKIQIIIVEVKKETCKLNGPWKESERQNIQYLLNAIAYRLLALGAIGFAAAFWLTGTVPATGGEWAGIALAGVLGIVALVIALSVSFALAYGASGNWMPPPPPPPAVSETPDW